MKPVIEDIVRDRPHLADPFRFYEKDLDFITSIRTLPVSVLASDTCYSPELIPDVFARFTALLGLPEGTLFPLKQAMELREVDFTRLPLGEVPAFSLPYAEDDLSMMLSLLSRPWFLALAEACPPGERTWVEGKCPVCHARPVLCWTGGEGRRHASCSYCGTKGYVQQAGCPVCLAADPAKQQALRFEREDSFSISTCEHCRSYVKTVDAGTISRWSPDLADLASLPLDIIVQERGYQRRAPNPIGMSKISTTG